MKFDELAFVNQQLAGMLRSGIPLESALRQLCATMKSGKMRNEFQQLENDLAQGIPVEQALTKRKFPKFYTQMISVGIQSNDLPTILTLLADYYQKVNLIWMRLKGLMVYPLLVLICSLGLSIFLASTFSALSEIIRGSIGGIGLPLSGAPVPSQLATAILFLPAIVLGLITIIILIFLATPPFRNWLHWKLPGFKEAQLSRFASSLGLLLKSGCPLHEALGLMQQLERGTAAGKELKRWQTSLAEGRGKFSDLAAKSKIIPPLFFWIVANEGEDWIAGLGRAAELYSGRALYRIEILLYAALPVSIILLGAIMVGQMVSLFRLIYVSGMGFFNLF